MKKNLREVLKLPLSMAVLALTACVNTISESTSDTRVPISFTAHINTSSTVTRVTDEGFESGDEIGLFAAVGGSQWGAGCYIENVTLTCGGGSILSSEENLYYPESGAALDFLAYYPYREDILQAEDGALTVAINQDQRGSGYAESDFMIAEKTGVESGESSVELNFTHAFSKLKFEIAAKEGSPVDLEQMLEDDPEILVSGFCTRAAYDLSEKRLRDFSDPVEITASGTWTLQEDKLVGKEVILMPQQLGDEQYITISWGGNIYTSFLSGFDLQQNTQRTVCIEIEGTVDEILPNIVGTVNPWEDSDPVQSEGNQSSQAILTASLDFDKSNVYRIYKDEQVVAEVCREYLYADGVIEAQAIVAYPTKQRTDETAEGIVLSLLNVSEKVHGGTVSWNLSTNELSYTAGNSAPVTRFYIDEEGALSLEKPEQVATVSVKSYVVRDGRNGLQTYPVVKVGTQYWMGADLVATTYRNGVALELQTELGIGNVGYCKPADKEYYFYTGEALLLGEMAPRGCHIPSTAEWKQLQEYVDDNAGVLKNGVWEKVSPEDETCIVSNLTYFNARPVGTWTHGQHWSEYYIVGYWAMDDGEIPEETFFLSTQSDQIEWNTTISSDSKDDDNPFYKALSIRCLVDD